MILSTLLAQITNPAIDAALGADTTGGGGTAMAILMARLFRTLVIIGGLAMLLFMAQGGISWITAGGDKSKVELARDKIMNAIIGMAILVAVIAVAILLSETFGVDLLNPTIPGGAAP